MNSINVSSNKIPPKVLCPTSKSYANRALMLAALDERPITLKNIPSSQDVIDMVENLKMMGLQIERKSDSLIVKNCFPACEKDQSQVLVGSEGGTTVRFLLTLLALGKQKYTLALKGKMTERPLDDQMITLKSLGADIKKFEDKVVIQGPIQLNQTLSIDCIHTTQFASAMLMLSRYFDFKVQTLNLKSSQAYFEMTAKIIKDFEKEEVYSIPADFSSASYLIAYAFTSQDLLVSNIHSVDTFQADSFLIELLTTLGGELRFDYEGLHISKQQNYPGFEVDVSRCLDLTPTLVYLALFADSPTRLFGIENLKYKESNRLLEISKVLNQIGAHCEINEDLVITPAKLSIPDRLIQVAPDHRIIMMTALILKKLGGGQLSPFKNVEKSFPEFFTIFQ